MSSPIHKGSCLCGSVCFEVHGELGQSDACHCRQCRKWTGHFLPSVEAQRDELKIIDNVDLSWHESSEKARRGFCRNCGSSLFFDPLDKVKHSWIGISLGAFDTAPGVTIGRHIFVAEKGDYYALDDGIPQNEY